MSEASSWPERKESSVRHQELDPSPLEIVSGSNVASLSLHPVGQSFLDGRTGVQGSQHDDRSDGGTSKLGRDIQGNADKAQHMDAQHFAGSTHRFEVFAAVLPQTEVQTLADRGLPDHVGVAFELIADCGSNEIGSVRVKALMYHQVDLAEVDVAEIDRDLLAVTGLWSDLVHIIGHDFTILSPSTGMVYGCRRQAFKGTTAAQLQCAWAYGVVHGSVGGSGQGLG